MIRRTVLLSALMAAGLTLAAGVQAAATITIVNQDTGTGKGLDDKTPATPVGGNPGTTRGDQALNVFHFAADLWGAVLDSDVEIINTATFQPLSCDATSGVLGSSGTNYIFTFNPGATLPARAIANTWYHSALADALAGTDLGVQNDLPPNTPDILSRFNGSLGTTGCLEGSAWYFGLDGKTPPGQINFLNVVAHEMAHGLGFSGFNNLATGKQNQDQQDIYSVFVRNNTLAKMWPDMTDAERQASALDDGNLVFTGATVKTEAPLALIKPLDLVVTAPANLAGKVAYNAANFGPTASPANFSGTVALPSGDPLACNVNGAAAPVQGVSGKIALIDRGACAFGEKALNAQAGGATGVIIANNVDGGIIPGGDAPLVTIPVVAVTQAVGTSFKAAVPGLKLGLVQGTGLAGADSKGNVQLYAPTTLAQGSSFSHYDTRLTPNAIMEYAISADLAANVDLDLTPALFKDEGWIINRGSQFLLDCNTGVPTSVAGGGVVGANIYGYARVLAAAAANVGAYRMSIRDHASDLASRGLLTAAQASSLNACLSDANTAAQYKAFGKPADPTAVELTNGVALKGQSGAAGSSTVYRLVVPSGALALNLRSYGGSGDVSLYVKLGAAGGPGSYDFSSVHRGNNESIVRTRPVPGTYYVTVVGETAFSNISVMGNYLPPR